MYRPGGLEPGLERWNGLDWTGMEWLDAHLEGRLYSTEWNGDGMEWNGME